MIDLWSESESGDDWVAIEPGLLSVLVPIRNELMAGDYGGSSSDGSFALNSARSPLAPDHHRCLVA